MCIGWLLIDCWWMKQVKKMHTDGSIGQRISISFVRQRRHLLIFPARNLFLHSPPSTPVVIPSVNTDLYSFNQYLQIELFGGHCCNWLIHPCCSPEHTESTRNDFGFFFFSFFFFISILLFSKHFCQQEGAGNWLLTIRSCCVSFRVFDCFWFIDFLFARLNRLSFDGDDLCNENSFRVDFNVVSLERKSRLFWFFEFSFVWKSNEAVNHRKFVVKIDICSLFHVRYQILSVPDVVEWLRSNCDEYETWKRVQRSMAVAPIMGFIPHD